MQFARYNEVINDLGREYDRLWQSPGSFREVVLKCWGEGPSREDCQQIYNWVSGVVFSAKQSIAENKRNERTQRSD